MNTTAPSDIPTGIPPAPAEAQSRQTRSRFLLSVGAALVLGATGTWIAYSRDAVARNEARAIAGEYPVIRLQTGHFEVDEFGRVAVDGLLPTPPLTVASTHLIPLGKYQAAIVANDGQAEHVKKTELVIAAQDVAGAWHPETAPQVLARLKTPRAGSPL